MNKLLAWDIIKSNVDKCEQKLGQEVNYKFPAANMSKIVLKNVSTQDVVDIIEDYLYIWGRMGRVLGRFEYFDWQANVAKQIQSDSIVLENFRTMQLRYVQLGDYYQEIIVIYDAFKKIVDNIAAAKILHIICPSFFPLWDNAIADGLRAEYRGSNKYKPFSSQDYFEFMKSIQTLMQDYAQLWSSLSATYNKNPLKIVDEYLWWTVRRPFSLIV